MKKNLENLSIEEKSWLALQVELKDLEENPKDFGMSKDEIVKQYLYGDDSFILDMWELYFSDIEE